MTATLTKPLSFQRLDDLLAGFRHPQRDSPASPQSEQDDEDIPAESEADAALRVPAVDGRMAEAQARLAEALGAGRARTVLMGILAELDQGLARLAPLADQPEEHLALASLAHRMAGCAAMIGFSQMYQCLIQLETEARQGSYRQVDRDVLHRQIAEVRGLMPPPEARLPETA